MIADLVVDAITADRYWVLPHPDFVEIAMRRFMSIGEGANPVPPEETPGMPPRSQLIAEVMAAHGRRGGDTVHRRIDGCDHRPDRTSARRIVAAIRGGSSVG